jgi:hypothetical protein
MVGNDPVGYVDLWGLDNAFVVPGKNPVVFAEGKSYMIADGQLIEVNWRGNMPHELVNDTSKTRVEAVVDATTSQKCADTTELVANLAAGMKGFADAYNAIPHCGKIRLTPVTVRPVLTEPAARAGGVLPADIASTFRGGNYGTRVLQSDVEAFRFSGGVAAPQGRSLTTSQTVTGIATPGEAISALNLPSGATATQIFILNPGVLCPVP